MVMKQTNLWEEIKKIKDNGFNPEGLRRLELYSEQFDEGKILYKRFSPAEQHGCSTGGCTHVIATLLAGAEVATSGFVEGSFANIKTEFEFAKKQVKTIKDWANAQGVWINDTDEFLRKHIGDIIAEGGEAKVYDGGTKVIKSIGLDYFIQPIYALDRITLHNTYFPETRLKVIGFGESDDEFKILVEQPYIKGYPVTDEEIQDFLNKLGFKLSNPRNWTYFTTDIYLSDMHDENIVKSQSGTFFVLDCDIRLNAPFLKTNGSRKLTTNLISKK